MKKMLKILGIIILVPIALIIILLVIVSFKPMTPLNYTKEMKTGGEIEEKYLANGKHKAKLQKMEGSEITKMFYIYYPEELESANEQYPVVVMLNGTGVLPKKYKAVFEHMTSWGFVVIGCDDGSSGFGKSADESIELIQKENADEDSVFYGKIDMEHIGITGHSQGGAGVFTALSVAEHKDAYKTAVAVSPTHEEMAQALGWNYDLEKINIPIMILAGTQGDFETQAVIPIDKMKQMYDKIAAPIKVMARRIGAEHGQMLYSTDGYVTAWFMWQLQGDTFAEKAFMENSEIKVNELYQDTKVN